MDEKKTDYEKENSTLINFWMPNHLKSMVDDLCQYKGVSRTFIMNNLVEKWCRSELKNIEEDNRLRELILKVYKTNIETEQLRREKFNPPNSKERWEDTY